MVEKLQVPNRLEMIKALRRTTTSWGTAGSTQGAVGAQKSFRNIDFDLDCVHLDMHETISDDFIQAFVAKAIDMTRLRGKSTSPRWRDTRLVRAKVTRIVHSRT